MMSKISNPFHMQPFEPDIAHMGEGGGLRDSKFDSTDLNYTLISSY